MTVLLMTLLLAQPAPRPALHEAALNETTFAELHRQLQPPPAEGWSSIAWKTSLVQACVQAAREKKPLLMVCRAGHPLGCV